MPSALKRNQTSEIRGILPGVIRARVTLVSIGAVLAVLVSWLPSPRAAFAASPAAGASAQLDRAAIIAATVVTWVLVVWLAAVLLIAVAARLILGGRHGRAVATRLAQLLLPRALRGAVITAVGIGSFAAVTGCAPGAAAAGIGTVAATTSSPGSASAGTAAPLTIDLDWPFDPPPVSAPVSTPPPFVPPTAGPDSAGAETAPPTTAVSPSDPSTSPPAAGPDPTVPGPDDTSTEPTAPPTSAAVTPPGAATDPARPEPSDPGASTDVEEVEDVLHGAGPTTPSAPATPPAPGVVPDPTVPSGPAVPGTPASPEAAAPAAPAAVPTPSADTADTVTVSPGDSLWSLAAAHLPVSASDSDIAEAWPRWYAANRELIGNDPGHIEPGWQLTVPSDREDHTP